VDIVITGRRLDVPDRFRRQAEEKLEKVSQFVPNVLRVDVELSHERNPRQSSQCERVEITVRAKGPVVRAEACSEDSLAALDIAFGKLVERLRRMSDRKKVHHGRHAPASVRVAGLLNGAEPSRADGAGALPGAGLAVAEREKASDDSEIDDDVAAAEEYPAGAEDLADSPVVIRAKDHTAVPMTIDQALYEMELVGHDFYLFVDAACGKPSVVYRRRGWNYGVIRLDVSEAPAERAETPAPVS
jgi:ribosomal subunit interface protein